jgi:elongator complex protein 2
LHAFSLEGHEDWVRCLAVTACPGEGSSPDLMLASGSQDNYVRLWRIAFIVNAEKTADVVSESDDPLAMLDEFERKLAGEAGGSTQISTKAHVLSVEDDGR